MRRPLRICFALAGLHRVQRGAEVAFESIAQNLAGRSDCEVSLFGSGERIPGRSYRFTRVPCIPRERFERWPKVPLLRSEFLYEELTFAASLYRVYRPHDFDVTLTCSYPFTSWLLRAGRGRRRPAHVFVTQNGDWPAQSRRGEYRFFSCDGLVCTNPQYFERNRERWRATLVPNGVDSERFQPGPPRRAAFGIPVEPKVVLMVSALMPSKRVIEGIRAVHALGDVFMVVAGDGPQRDEVDGLGRSLLGQRYLRLSLKAEQMPDLYRCADVFLHLARAESFGIVYVEALASGLPVVAADDPTPRWILGELGYFAADDASLDRVLRKALESPSSDVEPRVEAARRRFAWSSVALQYLEFLREVTG